MLFSKWFGGALPRLWLLGEAFHILCHLADLEWYVPMANSMSACLLAKVYCRKSGDTGVLRSITLSVHVSFFA